MPSLNATRSVGGSPFGRIPSLTAQIRELIHDYPEGIGIVKEVAQNADDAGASILEIFIDRRTYGTAALPDPAMAALQGPALLFFNDSVFTEDDFDRIQEIYRSGKIRAADKTGQFGKGFNTVYNVTDWPSFVTGERVAFFDPHCSVVPEASRVNPGRSWTLAECWESYPDLLAPFGGAGLENGAEQFDGTIFRLPMRTSAQAVSSEISRKPFGDDSLRDLIGELTEVREALLLFLKRLDTIRLREVLLSGEKRDLVVIETTNSEEVRERRQQLLDILQGDAIDVVQRIRDQSPTLFSYQHHFHSKWVPCGDGDKSGEDSVWRVVHCLNLGPDDKIAEAIETLTSGDVKAVPLGGAAARVWPVQGKEEPCGKIYCSLPLPIDTQLPVHLNGFFDLDSSRHSLTTEAGLTGIAKVRAQWNQLLGEHVVATAYARLIKDLVDDIGKDAPDRYYCAWPDPGRPLSKPLDAFVKVVYRYLAPLEVIRVHNSESWYPIGKVVLPPSRHDLEAPLVADRVPLPDPPLSAHIVAGFGTAGVDIKKVVPQFVRDRLRQVSRITHPGVPVSQGPRDCLRRREWLESLLHFCLSDHPKDLTDLPLALMANGQLRSFVPDLKFPIYVAGALERELFADQPEWFLDKGYAEACGLTGSSVPKGMYRMTPKEVTRCLPALLPQEHVIRLNLEDASSKFPTPSWLTKLYSYLLQAIRNGYDWPQEDFQKIPLVPDQAAVLRCPGFLDTPLLDRQERTKDLSRALQVLNVPMVTGPRQLRDMIAAFAEVCTGFIWNLTGPDVVDTLASFDGEGFPPYRDDVHPPLLNYLALPAWSDRDWTSAERISKLRQLRIFPTVDGRVVSLQEKVFVPGDFSPPACMRAVTILQTGPVNAWAPLLELAGTLRLSRSVFVQEHLLPEYGRMGPEDMLVALRWLRDNLERARSELEEQDIDPSDFLGAVHKTPLIRCPDGELRPASKIYDPDSTLIRDLFGETVPFPDRTFYAQGWDRWLDFFRGLGLVTKPQACDLVRHIDRLCKAAASELDATVTERILQTFDHINEHWEELCDEQVEDEDGKDFGSILRGRAWLPAETSSRGLKRWPGAIVPENRLYRPNELFLPAHANLVSSECPVFSRAKVKAEVQKALGFRSNVPLDIALRHFHRLLLVWKSDGRPKPDVLGAAMEDIYLYLKRFASEPESATIKRQFMGIACLWHRGRFWLPAHAFRSRVPYFGNRRATINVKEAIRPAYQLLGMRDRPCLDDFLAYLHELVDEFAEQVVPTGEVERLLQVYRRIGEEKAANDHQFALLTDKCTLANPQDTFYANAPWFQERIKHPRVQFLHRELPVTITQLPWVRSLADEVTEQRTGDCRPSETPEIRRRASTLESLINSNEFRRGVARLVYHERSIYEVSITDWLAQISVVAARKLISKLVLVLDGEPVVVGAGPSDQYLDEVNLCIYVDGNAGRLMRTFVAQAINRGLHEHRLIDLSPLADILDCEPSEIDSTLTRLRIRPVDDEGAFAKPDDDEQEGAIDGDVGESSPEAGDAEARSDGGATAAGVAASDDHGTSADYPQGDAQPEDSAMTTSLLGRRGSGNAGAGTEDTRESEATEEGAKPRSRSGDRSHARRRGTGAQTDGSSTRRHSDLTDRGRAPLTSRNADANSGRPDAGKEAGSDSGEAARTESSSPGRAGRAGARPSGGGKSSGQEVRMRRRGRRRRNRRGQDRMVTYVSFGPVDQTAATSMSEEERRERISIADAAVDLVCKFEIKHGRQPTRLPHNHPGWDIDSFDIRRVESEGAVGTPCRMIEVKGVRGPWTRQGVALSRRQFEAAQQYCDRYWLYVVEFADDPTQSRIHPVPNPFARITQFWFDNGWRQLADPTESPSATCGLAVGQRIELANSGRGVVELVEERGALKVIHVRLDNGELVRKPFNPGTMRPLDD